MIVYALTETTLLFAT